MRKKKEAKLEETLNQGAVDASDFTDPTSFPTASTQASSVDKKKLRPDLDRIVTRVFLTEALDDVYDRLEAALRIGERRSEPAIVAEALDNAETNLLLASRLHVTAKIERERWELENEPITATMRNEAQRALQNEKAAGERNKAITDADVTARISIMFPDQWAEQELRRRRIQQTEVVIGRLQEAWASRCRSLQVMLGRMK